MLSGYDWNDDIGFYRTNRDIATHFYIENLPKGKHVIEYTMNVMHKGIFDSGLAEIQAMYSPADIARMSGGEVKVE